jgi:putative endopeptidase
MTHHGSRLLATLLVLGLAAAHVAGGAGPALKSGVDRATFDMTVSPGQDFYQYVNGTWIKENPIPAEYSRWGAFPQLRDNNLVALHAILEELAAQPAPGDGEQRKLRDFYLTAMDESKLQQQGAAPLARELAGIADISDRATLLAELAHLRALGLPMLFSLSVAQDEKQSTRYAVHLRQGGLGLPERNYYTEDTEASKKIREQYREHVAKVLELLGDSAEAAAGGAQTVLRLETRLAEASRAPTELRDREANYHKQTLAELAALTRNVDWPAFFKAVELDGVEDAIVGQPEFFQRVDQMLADVPAAEWRVYLRWHLAHAMAAYLGDAFERENFRFYSTVLRGVTQMQPRWKRAIGTIDRQMGEALGKLYVERHFSPMSKQRMDTLIQNVMAVYRERIATRPWMGEETKKQALAKLATITPKIGYPSKWRDYASLDIKPDSYVQNVLRSEAFESRYRLSRLGQPVDRAEWHMTPPTVNAYYNSTMNEIVFPAGILQPPFFNPEADDAVNYGAIGAVIGHEMTHGFDDQGSRSDGDGNLKNWWTEQDRSQFNALTGRVVKQYDACAVVNDLHINGRLTLGENIADLGGVMIAYAAYQKSLGGKPAPVIDGFTGPQRFFIGYAQVWRGSVRDADQRLLLRTDPHSPPRFRTLVVLSNVPAFYEAFDVKPGEAMYRPPEERVEVW